MSGAEGAPCSVTVLEVLSTVVPLQRPSVFRERFGITTRHVALYSGNIANKQGIDVLVEAARPDGNVQSENHPEVTEC